PGPHEDAVWGEPVGGVQAGIAFSPGQKRAYRVGETVTFVVKVRNVSKKSLPVCYFATFPLDTPPTVEGARGKPAHVVAPPPPEKSPFPRTLTLAAGEEAEIGRPELVPASAAPAGQPRNATLVGAPGSYLVRLATVAWARAEPYGGGALSTGK